LWQSDGTRTGTRLFKDINPGGLSSNPGPLTRVGRTLFFPAYHPSYSGELWSSDGSSAGTKLVRDIYPGSGEFGGSYPGQLINVAGTLFFAAEDPTHGGELWKATP
jgi:ELWxxDGT repeat protein